MSGYVDYSRPLCANSGHFRGRCEPGQIKAGTHEMLEGQRPSRVVVVEYPSKQAIKDWYNDPGYRPLIAKRHAAARSVRIAVEDQ
jgi:uncharacterized protein (DUF1330 family)